MSNLVIFPAHLAVEPEGISPAQTRPRGIKVALQDIRWRHIRHPASLGRQLTGSLDARPETCEDRNGSECTEHHAHHAMYHGGVGIRTRPRSDERHLGNDHGFK